MPDELKAMRAAWRESRARCENPNHRQYVYYGGRGIKYCERWKTFENFVADMGIRPKGMTLERLNVNGDYEPSNCVWADRKTQSRNQRGSIWLTYGDETKPLMEWAEITGIKYETLKMRVRAGYRPEEVLTKPVKCGAKLEGRVYKVRAKPAPGAMPRGEAAGAAKLTELQVRAIRYMGEKKLGSASEIASMFGVTGSAVHQILRRNCWRHL